ncbi:MAG: hypothetical protein AABP62_27990 [Planctomycetota bacterium]
MNRLRIQVSLMAGLAMLATTAAQPAAADSVRVPIRTANTRVSQVDPNGVPVPVPASPTPLPAAPTPLPPAPVPMPVSPPPAGAPLPPQPVPDDSFHAPPAAQRQAPAPPGGGAMYYGPLGADFQPTEVPKNRYLGDGHHRTPQPMPVGPAPYQPGPPPDEVVGPGVPYGSGVISGPVGGTDRFGVAPPPGTLGQTYQRRTRLIDDEKHPRVGIVEVHLSENYEVTAKGLKVKWTGKVWRLESDPLLPGIPHIYEIKSEWGPEGAKQHQIRTVRLIMGRIVDLEF